MQPLNGAKLCLEAALSNFRVVVGRIEPRGERFLSRTVTAAKYDFQL
jgi:hypothetical protein